ncbi:hypothetical protein EMPS_08738 [Entomortierella parvispora]|uniref:DDHD domain-containing protein n=1 Tax=Entomortierella parvispora TaxID=205924 RepID=A0A9P3HGM6_9FUNG|nr:hypothetical protein EMPS_08738 [Entomortierella parvispora]
MSTDPVPPQDKDSVMATPAPETSSSEPTPPPPAPVPALAPTFVSSSETPAAPSSTSASFSSEPFQADKYPHHVIFVVHGMGRQLEPEFGNYERNVGYLVEHTKAVLQNQFQELKTDVHIIPTEWHAKLHNMVDERMSLASLRTVPKVRLVMNDYFADILYYFNNHYGGEIIRMIVTELNEAYETFIAKHPGFNGKISIYALSLGGVAMYDILTCIDDDDEEENKDTKEGTEPVQDSNGKDKDKNSATDQASQQPSEKKARIRKQDDPKFRIHVPKLKFRPDQLFTVGSPVGAVLVMRNLHWKTFHPPADIIHHNLFHPFDPLGYRIEPLIDPIFAGIPPVTITPYNASQQLFPSLSLPSLSLPSIPGSLSSFWENRVPTLPRPSIPSLTTSLSQMTQSLKAGRWLSSSSTSTTGTSTPVVGAQHESDAPEAASLDSTDHVVSDVEASAPPSRHHQKYVGSPLVMGDDDASVQEAIAAAAVVTYLDQPETNTSDTERERRAAAARTLSGRRPSLGPRRISSRVEDEQELIDKALALERGKMPHLEEESVLNPAVTPADASDLPLAQMEYILGMEAGLTAEEKARDSSSQCHVIQEPMVRSDDIVSDSEPTSSVPVTERKSSSTKKQKKRGKTAWPKLMVEGRPTDVPYRIDHVLQETTVDQYTNEYLLGMRSHFRYWGNRDVAFHILRNMLTPELTPPHMGGPEDTIDLHLDMPAPVTTAKGAREAAEAIARATARSRSNSTPTAEQEQERNRKKQNRMSFTFSFFGGGGGNTSSDDSIDQENGHDGDGQDRPKKVKKRANGGDAALTDEDFVMDEEGELFGFNRKQRRHHKISNAGVDIDMDIDRDSTFSSTFTSESHQESIDDDGTASVSSKRRISISGVHVHNSGKARAFTSTTLTNATTNAAVATKIAVPDLAKPPKLHHRTVRLDE